MSYNKTAWKDNQAPAINAANLNKMEQGIYDAHIYGALFTDTVPGTVQTLTFSGGNVSKIEHKTGNVAVRTDDFTYTDSAITEVRTMSTGESLTIVTDLDTLSTTVTYAAA